MLKNKKIVIGISGGIAAYKAIELCSMLTRQGAQVRIIMTENARRFVTELTLQVLSSHSVYTSLWDSQHPIPHIELADWADLIIVAPATGNVIAKAAQGLGDDLLTATLMAAHSPVLIIPAMNVNMYSNAATQANINLLQSRGVLFMEPERGRLACGYKGKGRYPANQEILYHIKSYLYHKPFLAGKKILVTAGACRENIDPMRFITNHSSGKMGIALARAAHILGAEVTLITAHTSIAPPAYLNTVSVQTAEQMLTACQNEFPQHDLLIMNAAVSDYKPTEISEQKIKKSGDMCLNLVRTPDVISQMVKLRKPHQLICGFAAESQNIKENALAKLKNKELDFIVANNISVAAKDVISCSFLSEKLQLDLLGDKFEVAVELLKLIYQTGFAHE